MKKPTLELIERVVCKWEKVPIADIHTNRRYKRIMIPRQEVMFFGLENGYTLDASARYFGLDHATANNSRISINNFIETDNTFARKIEEMRKDIAKQLQDKEVRKGLNLAHFARGMKIFKVL